MLAVLGTQVKLACKDEDEQRPPCAKKGPAEPSGRRGDTFGHSVYARVVVLDNPRYYFPERVAKARANLGKMVLSGASKRSVASRSPRVGPRLMIATGLFTCAALRTKR